MSSSRILLWQVSEGAEEVRMDEPNHPAPGRSTSEAAVSAIKKEIARRNEEVQKAARAKRAVREKEHLANLRKWQQQ